MKRRQQMKFDVDNNKVVRVYAKDQDPTPFLIQPTYPNGAEWKDKADAEAWAALFIASIENPDAPFAPNGPGMQGRPKPTPEQKAIDEANRQIARAKRLSNPNK